MSREVQKQNKCKYQHRYPSIGFGSQFIFELHTKRYVSMKSSPRYEGLLAEVVYHEVEVVEYEVLLVVVGEGQG